jgi:pSer/pThr/pTyr-binding forkhead associated (FHA) protein
MKLHLVSSDPLALCRQFELSSFPVVLGRGEAASVKIDDRWLSRTHCELRCEGGSFVVRDLGSKYGTFVNGRRIREATLEPGDELGIGLSKFVARLATTAAEPAVAMLV